MDEIIFNKSKEYALHMQYLNNVSTFVLNTDYIGLINNNYDEYPDFCKSCTYFECNYVNTHHYGCSEAYRWNGRYIYYCPLGLIFISASICDAKSRMSGCMTCGPIVMGNVHDTLEYIRDDTVRNKIRLLPEWNTEKVNHFAEILPAITSYVGGTHPNNTNYLGVMSNNQNDNKKIQYEYPELSVNSLIAFNQVEYEKRLQNLIIEGDKKETNALLNDLLGGIYFSNYYELQTIKLRVVELIVLLSRAGIDAGANPQHIFAFNGDFIKEIYSFLSLEELSVWLKNVIKQFINYVFDFSSVQQSDIVFKAKKYIRSNYSKRISLEDIARYVCLSRAYLSSVFKKEAGKSLMAYLNSVRVENSKILLLDTSNDLVVIAGLCGFEDQSYFTKVFKKELGVSPGRYRECHGQIPKNVPKN